MYMCVFDLNLALIIYNIGPHSATGGLVVAAWLSGSALVSINVVTLRQAGVILGWVTVYG